MDEGQDNSPIVVVIDDNTAVLELFSKATQDMGIELKTFSSSYESMNFLEEIKPDLMFLDILMPDKDGLTFLQELRAKPLHNLTSVIMITSKDYAQDRTLANELGALDFLPKPMPMKDIQDIIKQQLEEQNKVY